MAKIRSEQLRSHNGGFADFGQNGIAVPSRFGPQPTSMRPLEGVNCPQDQIRWIIWADEHSVAFRSQGHH